MFYKRLTFYLEIDLNIGLLFFTSFSEGIFNFDLTFYNEIPSYSNTKMHMSIFIYYLGFMI